MATICVYLRHLRIKPSEETSLLRWSPERISRQIVSLVIQVQPSARDLEHRSDLIREDSGPALSNAPLRVVQFSFAQLADAVHDFVLSVGIVLLQPAFEQRRYGPGQPQN